MKSGDAKGRQAELIAAWYLRLKGYRVLAQRHKTSAGEIDLVAAKGKALAFIEVKYRPDTERAAASITERQQLRIAAAARAFLARHPQWATKTLRFDVLYILPRRLPRHLLNAWAAPDHNAH